MNISELTEADKKEYNHFLIHNNGSFLQSWEWGEWQVRLGRTVYRFKIEDESENQINNSKGDPFASAKGSPLHGWLGAVQLVKMPLWGKRYYVYAPYGPVFAAGEQLKVESEKLKGILQELRQKFPDAVFARIEPQSLISLSAYPLIGLKKSTNIQPGVTIIVDVNKTDEELLAAMHPKTRYNIKLAQKHGVEVQSEMVVTPGHGLYVQQTVDLIVQTQDRQKYRGHSASYYHQLIDFFAHYNLNSHRERSPVALAKGDVLHHNESDLKVIVYKTLYQRQLLATGIMVDFGPTRVYLYGGSSDDHKNLMAPFLLHWQAMQDAREKGLLHYDLGGSEVSSGGEKGFTRFKKGFGGRIVEYAGAWDLPFYRGLYRGYGIMRLLNRALTKFK